MAARALLFQPHVEPRRREAVGALLALGGAYGERIRVLVLGVPRVAFDPLPRHVVPRGGLIELLPQRQVFDFAAFTLPAPCLPGVDPLAHALDQVLRVGDVCDGGAVPLAVQPFEDADRAGERHAVVGGVGRELVEIPPRHTVAGVRLDQRGVAAGVGGRGAIAEATLVSVDQDARQLRAQGWITTGMSVLRRISSACDAVGTLARSRGTWAPANRASHLVLAITRATTSPGRPVSRCVTNGTRSIDSNASASPTTASPASRSAAAWMMCTVLSPVVAKRAASSSARLAVSRPSYATAHCFIGDGVPPHTITLAWAMRMSDATVGPSASSVVTMPRRPTSTASAPRARSASVTSASPSFSTASNAAPTSTARSCARCSMWPSSSPWPGSRT